MEKHNFNFFKTMSMINELIYLVGAGLAAPDGVRELPFVFVADAEPTDSRDGRGVDVVNVTLRRVGMRVCVSSVLSNDKFDPCRLGGFEPLLLTGREFGLEFPREPPGVIPVLLYNIKKNNEQKHKSFNKKIKKNKML